MLTFKFLQALHRWSKCFALKEPFNLWFRNKFISKSEDLRLFFFNLGGFVLWSLSLLMDELQHICGAFRFKEDLCLMAFWCRNVNRFGILLSHVWAERLSRTT